jgi:hypothetical protein
VKKPDENSTIHIFLFVGNVLFEDGTGQHAVEIRIGLDATNWRHILIYDKNDNRIKTIKYADGHYAS